MRRIHPFLLLAWALLTAAVAAQGPPAQDAGERSPADDVNLARENPALREFFLAQYYDVTRLEYRHSFVRNHPRRRRDPQHDRFVERIVDKRIDHYVEELRKRIGEVEKSLEAARDFSRRMKSKPGELNRFRKPWKDSFDNVADGLDAIRDRIAMVFLDLDGGIDFNPRTSGEDLEQGFPSQIAFIEERFREGSDRVRDLLIRPNHTVHASELGGGENILTLLEKAKKMAEHLRDRL